MQTPTGGAFVERPWLAASCAAMADAAAFAVFGILFALARIFTKRVCNVWTILIMALTWLYIIVCAVNDQIMRWMGQHLTFSFLSTYSPSRMDSSLVANIVEQGFLSFAISVLIALGLLFAFVFLLKKGEASSRKVLPLAVLIVVELCVVVASSQVTAWNKPCRIRWKRIQPPYVTLYNDYRYASEHSVKPENYAAGIRALGGDSLEYPFFHLVENEDSVYANFKSRPLSEKPDIVLLTLESFRGWVGDVRIGKNCERMKNFCKIARQGTFFPYTYSVGYPSTEGMLGLQLGIWSHPNKIFLSELGNVNATALPEILGRAGYHRIVLTAAEPSFDNFTPWFERWFDYHEYNPKNNTDIPLARRFAELYANRPKDKPLYFDFINFVTHIPFTVPSSFATPAATSDERYAQAVAYLDSAIGIVLDVIAKGSRANETIIVLTGDHSIANAKAQLIGDQIGEAASTYTWTSFVWVGPGIPEGTVKTLPVSHVDFAPTILSRLGLDVTNNFVGENLFADSLMHRPVFSFRHEDAVVRRDSVIVHAQVRNAPFAHARRKTALPDWDTTETIGGFVVEPKLEMDVSTSAKELLDAMHAWEWVLDRNLLAPDSKKF